MKMMVTQKLDLSHFMSLNRISIEFQILSKNVKCKAALDVDDDIKISFDVMK